MNAPRERRAGAGRFALYRCPTCAQALAFSGSGDEGGGLLACAAGHAFPVAEGLPRFVADEGYAGSFGLQWNEYSRTQVDSATGSSITSDRLFRGTGWPTRMEGETILEAGCGSGRFTEVLLATGARVVSFDYSRAADVTWRSFCDAGAEVCQASIYEMPYARGSFDRVFCYGVIQHCPDVALAFRSLVEMVRPGGHLAVDVYDRRRLAFTARYRVRWLTRRMDRARLLRWCRAVVPAYMRLFPPLHPWHQLLFPLKDYRGVYAGLTAAQEVELSVLDTFDALSPAFDQPQYVRTMQRWCREAGLVDVEVKRGGNGIEVRARRSEG
ncbi:MAG: SAM-dependent methyltransferase [Myxococcales bacterium]|nr:SAM-dependent methyltransferase [Myxococcales bacterium]